jgi:2-oxoglutarate dehydrogenase E2 component (dihydrolipoamide succinyltransferase)
MATELKVPALGESITEAVIARWLKKVGEATAADEPVVDLETDKVSVQLPAPAAGVLVEQKYPEGATVKVGDIIGAIDAKATATAAPAPAAERKPAATVAPAAAPAPAPAPVAAAPAPAPAPAAVAATTAPAPVGANGPHHEPTHVTTGLTPSERKALRENGTVTHAPVSTPGAAPAPAVVSRPAIPGLEEVVPLSPLRKRIAERLVQAQHTAAILTTFNEVDMSAVMALRAKHQDEFVAKNGIKLGFMSFFVKAAIESLRNWPGLNAEMRGNEVVYKKFYDIGVAVGGGKGLVVPVLRGADKMGFGDIEKGIAALAKKAQESKLTLEELSGGTFTISNGGIYGSMMSTPLLNMPQTGILGLHNIVKRAVVVSDKAGDRIEIKPMMYLALSYDHRVVDGREAVSFLVGVKERIEQPDKLLFGL